MVIFISMILKLLGGIMKGQSIKQSVLKAKMFNKKLLLIPNLEKINIKVLLNEIKE